MNSAAEILTDLMRRGIIPEALPDGNLAFPPGVLSDADRMAIRANKPELHRLILAGGLQFVAKGLPPQFVEHVIQLIAGRDDSDDRKSCAECQHYHGGRCAVLKFPIGHCEDIAVVLHRCDGFTE